MKGVSVLSDEKEKLEPQASEEMVQENAAENEPVKAENDESSKKASGKSTGEKEKGSKKEKELQKKLDEEQKKLADLNDSYLRLRAEYDNFRKRTASEKSQIYGNATSDAVSALLPVADNIERALSHQDSSENDLKKGLEMINSQIISSFEALGVTTIGEIGEVFDPNKHNAVSHIEDDSAQENTIVQVLQKGYMLGDKVIRYAMVQVAN